MRRDCFCMCVCVSICETNPSSEGLAALSSSASAILLRALSLAKLLLSVCSAYLDATTSVISAGSLWQLQSQSLPVLIQSQRDLVSFFFCLSAASQWLCTDISKQSDLLVGTCNVWSVVCTWGLCGSAAHPVQKFFEVCWKKKKKDRKKN